jgi:hypothetical protein
VRHAFRKHIFMKSCLESPAERKDKRDRRESLGGESRLDGIRSSRVFPEAGLNVAGESRLEGRGMMLTEDDVG